MPLEKQVKLMAGKNKAKKIILVIVEGISDEISLSLVLSRIIGKNKLIKFKVMGGDITTEHNSKPSNIQDKLSMKVKQFLSKHEYKKSDILEIIHIVDIDGCYISQENIEEKGKGKIYYTPNRIFTSNPQAIIQRNQQKSEILSTLVGVQHIFAIPYSIYYFSCNLEHVLYNEANMPDNRKVEKAHSFEDKYSGEPWKFVNFINTSEFAYRGRYKHSWDYIKKKNNSLKRKTNFNLFINRIAEKDMV